MSTIDAWRVGGPAILALGVVEPTVFFAAEPEQIGERFLAEIRRDDEWFAIANHMARAQTDPSMIAMAMVRIAAVRLVGS